MKKLVALFLVLLMLLSLAACGENKNPDSGESKKANSGENKKPNSGENKKPNSGENSSQSKNESSLDSTTQKEPELSKYQVTQEQWETAFEYGENGEILLENLSNHTCRRIDDVGRESVYKQVPEENLYYHNSISYESEYYYFHKGNKVDVYACNNTGCIMFPDDDWESQKLNATDNLKYDLSYFALTYDYDNVTFSEEENAYIYNGSNCEIKVYFENGKLVRLSLIDARGASSDYSQIGTTEIILPTEYEVRN